MLIPESLMPSFMKFDYQLVLSLNFTTILDEHSLLAYTLFHVAFWSLSTTISTVNRLYVITKANLFCTKEYY